MRALIQNNLHRLSDLTIIGGFWISAPSGTVGVSKTITFCKKEGGDVNNEACTKLLDVPIPNFAMEMSGGFEKSR